MTKIMSPSKTLIFSESKEINDTKEELFNTLDFIRQARAEVKEMNDTQEAIVEVRPSK